MIDVWRVPVPNGTDIMLRFLFPISHSSSFPIDISSCFSQNIYSNFPISSSWRHQSNPSCLCAARQYLDILYPCEQLQNISSPGATMSALCLARAIANRLKLSARYLSRSKDMATSTTSGHETSIPVVCVSRCFIAPFRNYTELRQVFPSKMAHESFSNSINFP